MDSDLENVIRQALADAQTAGRDHLAQMLAEERPRRSGAKCD